MTGGPHKSLPMKRPWKKVAERAWNQSYTCDQVAESIPLAVGKECDHRLVQKVRAALSSQEQSVLFPESVQSIALRVEALRLQCSGSSFGNNLIDAVIYGIYHGGTGSSSLREAVGAALRETTASAD